ncbi:imm11 family protein [Burkholderia sp. GS2Y]|uniref:DUF1629 domain-containing protein n=1 Tax=Burkholderia theae TaxID=3143496 RepID=A0ABU9WDG9_9BURK
MTEKSPNDLAAAVPPRSRRTAKAGKFFAVSDVLGRGSAGYEIVNRDAVLQNTTAKIFVRPLGGRGFPDYPVAPRLLFDKKFGRPVRDLERREGFWLVSDRAKVVFESIDPDAFAFLRCEVQFLDGSDGPVYWLCDVLPDLDAVDEARSIVEIKYESNGEKYYSFMKPTSLEFHRDLIESRHIFRLTRFMPKIICDEIFRQACKDEGLTGIRFREAKKL